MYRVMDLEPLQLHRRNRVRLNRAIVVLVDRRLSFILFSCRFLHTHSFKSLLLLSSSFVTDHLLIPPFFYILLVVIFAWSLLFYKLYGLYIWNNIPGYIHTIFFLRGSNPVVHLLFFDFLFYTHLSVFYVTSKTSLPFIKPSTRSCPLFVVVRPYFFHCYTQFFFFFFFYKMDKDIAQLVEMVRRLLLKVEFVYVSLIWLGCNPCTSACSVEEA
jgi:hypothetical protein